MDLLTSSPMKRSQFHFKVNRDLNYAFLQNFEHVILLNSESDSGSHLLALEAINGKTFSQLDLVQNELNQNPDWYFGYLAYDLKNEIEKLESKNEAYHNFKNLEFFNPRFVVEWTGHEGIVHYRKALDEENNIQKLIDDLFNSPTDPSSHYGEKFEALIDKSAYVKKIERLLGELAYGNIYEVNFCQQFRTRSDLFSPYLAYPVLREISPVPFASFLKFKDQFALCASPERFIKKSGNRLISQPIKGTIKRGQNQADDLKLREKLLNSQKDRRENVMIVDLVRNDLSRVAERGSVKVDELFGVYTFPQVHQLISTVSCELKKDYSFRDVIRATFPMGSMTGAPKIKAMQIIEREESFKRELFSGSIGYIHPNGDFDFNVVIRSLFYSRNSGNLSFSVGGAITSKSSPTGEYEESILKAKALFQLFSQEI